MKFENPWEVIIIGGSYSGLAAAMALGRALKKVLVIDDGKPCNRQTPYSHNFLTNDGRAPGLIKDLAKQEVSQYKNVNFYNGLAVSGSRITNHFAIQVDSGEIFVAKKLIFATGIRDILPAIAGFAESWGISVLHCPYCHGYEVKNEKTGIFFTGNASFDFVKLISNWTDDLTLFTNGPAALSAEQLSQLDNHRIPVIEKEIERLEQVNGHLQSIVFTDGATHSINSLYTALPFEQHCPVPQALGCALTEDGYIQVDAFHETTIKDIYACGDNVSRMRTVANAVATGTTTGMMLSKKMILDDF